MLVFAFRNLRKSCEQINMMMMTKSTACW